MSELALAQNLLPAVRAAKTRFFGDGNNELVQNAKRQTKPSNVISTSQTIMSELRTMFFNITGADLISPPAVWKYEYILNAVVAELPLAIDRFNGGSKTAGNYVLAFLQILGELDYNLQQYIKNSSQNPQPPKGTPFDPPPFNPTLPVDPTQPVDPKTQTPTKSKNAFLYLGAGLFLAKLLKIF